ncbi:ribosome maturation factor RimP [Natronocella acetinitrilica]|jgi:ribosome maturation factor RimP|uniref:Ribosome maturation factor RimP n=1 Tax=Natronocella acetinitrilica TaxID=414046 RepID=A0AAE3G447_9GAMM|nr:ribosome maturation factor RimP [Natronocella acetinitrilica]MCP1674744.1 ribosome maturation factor RimP [Natronocella acetinitrilica]
MDAVGDRLRELFEPVVTSMGYELLGVQYKPAKGEGLMRVYIDAEAGITVDDCALVSHQISGLLDVEDPVPGHYRLEVSSPGMDRPLFTPEQFQRFAGVEVKIRLQRLWEGRRSFRGTLRGAEGGNVMVEENGLLYTIPADLIDRANVVADV